MYTKNQTRHCSVDFMYNISHVISLTNNPLVFFFLKSTGSHGLGGVRLTEHMLAVAPLPYYHQPPLLSACPHTNKYRNPCSIGFVGTGRPCHRQGGRFCWVPPRNRRIAEHLRWASCWVPPETLGTAQPLSDGRDNQRLSSWNLPMVSFT